MTRPRSTRVILALLAVFVFAAVALIHCAHTNAGPAAAADRDVVYGTVAGQNLLLDVYRCPAPGTHPALLLIHGGGWAAGSKRDNAGMAAGLVLAGFTCFSVEYRFAPTYKHPAQVDDCACAARWVRAHAAEYAIDPARLGAVGGSAGGHLSLMLGVIQPGDYASPDDPNRALPGNVECVVDLFGPADLTHGADLSKQALDILVNFLGGSFAQVPDKYADASPVTHVTKNSAPTFMIHGASDTLVPLSQSQMMKAALDKAGVPNELVVIAKGEHGFGGADQKDVAAAYKRSVEWLKQYLMPPPPDLH
jgi:acetyl esterase/lipase